MADRPASGVLERFETAHNRVRVVRIGRRVEMQVRAATFATWHPSRLLTGYAWDALSAGCLLRGGGPPRSVLMLGYGGGTIARQLRAFVPVIRIVGVEIDAQVVAAARRHMGADETGAEIVVGDAYAYLDRSRERFDAIVDDLYLTGASDVERPRIPAGGTLELLRGRLAPGGVLVANLITDEGGHRADRRAARAAFAGAFREVRTVTPPHGLNEILVGGARVSGRTALRPFTAALEEASDRRLFAALRVRALDRR
ncbi:MAG: fused MFS/spermidine synthase [Acidobacteria bacterium]|nr:fused MFS/spermidine synthase [Acidobacteriota bacterium]